MIERINLVPAKPIAAKLRLATPLMLGLLLAVILVFLAGKYFLLNYRLNKTGAELAAMQVQVDQASQFQIQQTVLTKELTNLNNQVVQLKGEVAKMSMVQQEKNHFSGVLARIATALPATVRCRSLTLHEKAGEIEGVATDYKDLPDFAASLKNDGLFKKAVLHDLGRSPAGSGNRFSYKIIFELN